MITNRPLATSQLCICIMQPRPGCRPPHCTWHPDSCAEGLCRKPDASSLLSGVILHPSLLCVLPFLGRNLKICKPGQQCERKPEADSEAAPAPEGYGRYSRWPSLRAHGRATQVAAWAAAWHQHPQSAGHPCFPRSCPGPYLVCSQQPWEICRKDVITLI